MDEFDEAMLPGLLAHEIEAALRFDSTDAAKNRAENIEYLRGEMKDIQPRPNGSEMTSRDIQDTVSWMLPGIMRVFTASDRMGVYEPAEPGDDAYAEQATDYANYVFWKDNDGYKVLYNATYDALGVAGDGIVKHWWDDTPVTDMHWYTGLTIEQIAGMVEDENIEILSQQAGEPQAVQTVDKLGQPVIQEIETYDVKIQRTRRIGTLRLDTIEPENFLINEEAIEIEDFRFCAHRDPFKTRSDLIEMGFDREKVEKLSAETSIDDTDEGFARHEHWSNIAQSLQSSMERVDLYECYVKIDVDKDGVAETLRIYYAGHGGSGEVLDWEVWEDDVPFTKIPCYPRAHQFTSESVADRTKDIQRIKTVLLRQSLDNLYASNLPMQEVEQGSVLNPDILVSPKFGGIIWKKKTAGEKAIIPHEIPFVADKAFAALEQMDSIIEKRTGVSRTMMALDPEALQNQTATASQNARDASYSQTELVARNMAEGWRKVFLQILKLLVKHQDRPRMIRLRDEYVEMDPRVWNAHMDCAINVGLGSGSRDRDMSMLSVILQNQRELTLQLRESGFGQRAIAMLPKINETLHDLAESAGIRSPERYFPEFTEEDVQAMQQQAAQAAEQPPPEVQLEMEKLKVQREKDQMQMERETQKEQAQMEADLRVEAEKRQNELTKQQQQIQWEREKFRDEMNFKYHELQTRRQIELQKMNNANDGNDSSEAA